MEFDKFNKNNPNLFENVPKNKGIYFWFQNSDDLLVYIGIATGVGGIYKRIVLQHLNPKYIEFRASKHTSKDQYQLNYPIRKYSKNGLELKKGIDKSAFRKSIGRSLQLKPKDETLNFIKDNLYFKYLELNDTNEIRIMENQLIKKFKPMYNTALKGLVIFGKTSNID